MVHLFVDDLEEAIARMQEARLDLRISDNEYEYSALDEVIEKRGARPRTLTISAGRTTDGASLVLQVDGAARIAAHRHRAGAGVALSQIERLLSSRQNPILSAFKPQFFVLAALAV